MNVKVGSVIWTHAKQKDGRYLCSIGVIVGTNNNEIQARVIGWKVDTSHHELDKEVFTGYVVFDQQSLDTGEVLVFLDFWPVMNRLRTIKEKTKLDSELYREVVP